MRTPFILSVLLAVLGLATSVMSGDRKPNILFLFADDFAYNAVRARGATDVDTPHLDKLASRGTTFTHAYNMGSWSGAVCVASRTMLITGRSVWSANSIYQTTDAERKAGVLWPQLMKSAGYQTFMTGKWHIQTDAAKCFDLVKDVRAGMPKTVPSAYNRPLAGQPDPWNPADPSLGGFWEGGQHWSEVVAAHTMSFLEAAKHSQEPFFIYAAFNAPHDPRQAPQSYLDRYPLEKIKVPSNFLPSYPHKDDIGCQHKLRDENLAPMPRTELAIRTHRREYYALITHLDDQVGKILAALDASGQADNTWIFFTADHGLAVGQHGLMGKQNMYDHSVRVPFFVAGPGVPQGKKIAAPIYLQDVMATALDLAKAERPKHLFYHSLLPLIRGETATSPYPEVYGAYLNLQRSITHEGWKLMVYPKAKVQRLYHLATDPEEMHDLAASPEHQARRADLFDRLVTLADSLGDELDLKPLR